MQWALLHMWEFKKEELCGHVIGDNFYQDCELSIQYVRVENV